MMSRRRTLLLAALAFVALGPARIVKADYQTYLAVGDSLAFGFGTSSAPSPGNDRGYVAPYDTFLAAGNGGTVPHAIDLGVYGETSSSFFAPNSPGALLNTNYSAPAVSQDALMQATIGANPSIGTVTVQLGSNDLYALLLNPAYQTASQAVQLAMFQQALGTFGFNEMKLLTELKGLLPHANVLVLNYYNPYPGSGSPFEVAASHAIPELNKVIKQVALGAGDIPVDISAPFVGHEASFTHVQDPGGQFNVHPTGAGYDAITLQLENATPAAVPEPSSIALLALGGAGTLVAARRRGRRAA